MLGVVTWRLAVLLALGSFAAARAQVAVPAAPDAAPSDAAPPDAAPDPAGPIQEPQSAGADTPDAPSEAGAAERPRAVVVDAAAYGIAPVVAEHVTRQMRATAAELGYAVLTRDETVRAAQRLRMPYPPSPADLWRLTYLARSRRGAFARVWAHQGRYVIEVSVASRDGAGPFFARGTAGAEDLHEVVDRLTREALPAPEVWDAQGDARFGRSAQPAPTAPRMVPVGRPPRILRRRRVDRRPTRRFDLAVQLEGAIGTSNDHFFNFLGGARLGFRITNTVHLGLYLGYANLRGRDGRANNLLPLLQVENRIRLGTGSDITVPLRFGLGYLPFNGPVVRLAAGLNVPVSPRVELAFDLLAPTIWVLPGRTTISLNLSAELIFRL